MKITIRASWVGLVAAPAFIQIVVALAMFTSAEKQFNDDDEDLMLREVGSQVSAMGDGHYGNLGKGFRSQPYYGPTELPEECLHKRIAYRYNVYCSSVEIEDRVHCGGAGDQHERIAKKDCVQGLGCCFDDATPTPTLDQGDQVSQVIKCFHPNLKHAEVARLKYKSNSAAQRSRKEKFLHQQQQQ